MPVPRPGLASRGTSSKLAKCEKKPRQGTYSPNGTRWTFSNSATSRPDGAKATISFRNRVVPTGSVTPATSVAWWRRATDARIASSAEPAKARLSATTSSGQTMREVPAGTWAVSFRAAWNTTEAGTCNWLSPLRPPPCTTATRMVLPCALLALVEEGGNTLATTTRPTTTTMPTTPPKAAAAAARPALRLAAPSVAARLRWAWCEALRLEAPSGDARLRWAHCVRTGVQRAAREVPARTVTPATSNDPPRRAVGASGPFA